MNTSYLARARAWLQPVVIVLILAAVAAAPVLPAQAGVLPQDGNPPVVLPAPQTTPAAPDEPAPFEPGAAPIEVLQPTTAADPRPFSDEQAISAAVFKRIGEMQELSLAYLIHEIKIDTIKISPDGNQAAVWLAFYDRESGQLVAGEPALALAERGEDGWQVTLQVEEGWSPRLETVPDGLVSAELKERLIRPAPEVSAEAGTVYKGYKLPWAGGSYNFVTGSIGHVLTYKSCPSTCMYAFDFADGTMFPVHAAKAGRVKYAYWSYANGNTSNANYLVVEDASTVPTTYQVYYHLAKDSIPTALRTVGAVVNQGQYLGLADDTGYSTGHHLHFHVHTSPSSVWGTSVDIVFSDVLINGGRPRTCSESAAYPEYGSVCQSGNKFLSGNKTGTLPAAPKALAPTGTIYTSTPTLEWSPVSGGMQYYLYINKSGSSTYIVRQLVNASTACSDGKCKAVVQTALAAGAYQLRVRVGTATGWSPSSAIINFTIKSGLEIPEQVAPTGTIYYNNPAYTWKPVAGADRYYLVVYSDKSATNIIYRTLMAADVCGAETCAYTSTINVTHGTLKWKVRAGTALGWSTYSPQLAFRAYLAPLPPVLVSPVTEVKERAQRPLYRWTASAGATRYSLQVYSLASSATLGTYTADSTFLCSGEACSWRVALNLAAGKYKYRVRAYNGSIWGDYSAYKEFTVQLVPDAPELVSPSGAISTFSPAYTWKKMDGPTQYYLMVWSVAEGKYIIYRTLLTENVCGAETCSYVSTANVVSGRSYRFKVRAYNSFGWGAYSPEMAFNVE